MLPPNFLENIENQAINLYSNLELEIIEEISKRITNVGYANTVVHNDVLIAQEMGLLYQDIVSLVSKNTEKSYEEIQRIFEDEGIETLKFDDKIYKAAGLNPIPVEQSKSMLQFLTSTANKTNSNLKNLCMTTANTSQQEFINAIDKAYLEVSTGVKSYTTSIIDTVKELSKTSSKVEYPSGYRTSIENAVRMNIVTGVNQTCGKLQEMRADEMGWDLMELTAHGGARPEHAEWQGKIVSRSGQKGYLSLDDIGYGEPTGFKGVNCRHDWYPYFKGSSTTYSDKQLNLWKNETVSYNGQKISKYNATQIQRKIERQIRQDKKDIAGLQGILTSNNKDDKMLEEAKQKLQNKNNKLKEHNSLLDDFVKQTNSKKDYNRLYIGGNTKLKNENTLKTELKRNKIISSQLKDFRTIDEAKEYVYSNYKDSDIDKIKNVKAINVTFKTLNKLQNQYPLNQKIYIRNKTMSGALASGNYQGININTGYFNKANKKALLGNDYIKDINKKIEDLKQYLGNMKYKQKPIENGIKKLEEQKKFKCYSISGSYSDQYEFFAECFAKKQMGGKLPDYINEMLERVLKNGK